nr:phosphoribosylaminoimidazolesuccinocarboxamide synthase [Bacteroidia bacterium]
QRIADHGHDQDISREEIFEKGIISEDDYLILENYTRTLFAKGTEMASHQDLILVDTKYEFGKSEGEILVIDEIHTPDSSRYFYAKGYDERQKTGEQQKQLSKEFLRQWLIENQFQGLEGQQVPEMKSEIVQMVSDRYIELYESVRGQKFDKADTSDLINRVESNILKSLEKLRTS